MWLVVLAVLLVAVAAMAQEVTLTPRAEIRNGVLTLDLFGRGLDRVTWIRISGETVRTGWTTTAHGTRLTLRYKIKSPLQEEKQLKVELGPGDEFVTATVMVAPKKGGQKTR